MSTLSTTNLKNASSGSNNIVLATDGSATIATLSSTTITGTTIQGTIKSGTASGPHPLSPAVSAVDFANIPSWAKRITVIFNGVSQNSATQYIIVQLGDSGGIEATGYASGGSFSGASSSGFTSTAGFVTGSNMNAAGTLHGLMIITLLGSNTWVASFAGGLSDANYGHLGGGSKTLSDTLTQLRITTVGGTATFDAGNINLLWEG